MQNLWPEKMTKTTCSFETYKGRLLCLLAKIYSNTSTCLAVSRERLKLVRPACLHVTYRA